MKRKPRNPAFAELKAMAPAFLLINGIILIGVGIYGIFSNITYRAFTGVLLGNVLCIGNFILAGASAVNTITKATAKKGRFFANVSYGGRYIGMFAAIAIGLTLDVIDIIPTFLPLFIPKIYYTAYYALHKGEKEKDLDEIR